MKSDRPLGRAEPLERKLSGNRWDATPSTTSIDGDREGVGGTTYVDTVCVPRHSRNFLSTSPILGFGTIDDRPGVAWGGHLVRSRHKSLVMSWASAFGANEVRRPSTEKMPVPRL